MRLLRSIAVTIAFLVFNLGALPVTLLLLPICWHRGLSIAFIRLLWRIFIRFCQLLHLFRLNTDALDPTIRGAIIAANHPSLIDAVFIVARIPKTIPLARHGLRKNPFFRFVVANILLPDNADLLQQAPPLLAKGYNILIFPEGTRSPDPFSIYPFHRGTAQLSLRTGAPIHPIRIAFDRRVLAKGQSPFDMGATLIHCSLTSLPPLLPPPATPNQLHHQATQLTHQLETLLNPATPHT